MVKRAGLGLGLLLIAVIGYFALRGDDEASAEQKYDGVHLCAPSQQEAATVAARGSEAGPSDGIDGDADAARTEGPLFAQNSTAWGNDEYDHAAQQDVGCGTTIAQCGCAMTSVATVLSVFGTMSLPTGEQLNPSTLNGWFNEGAQFTGDGFVSHGYSYGNVVWTAVNNIAAGQPGAQPMRFAGWGTGSEQEIRDQLAQGNGVVLEVPGHYIAVLGLQDAASTEGSSSVKPVSLEDELILINDPYYADRTTLDSYAGLVRSSRIYEPGEDLSAVMITVPANQRVKVTDSQGREVGTLGGDTPQDAQAEASTDIGQTHFEEAWRDPTCTERPPEEGDGTISIFIPGPEAGDYNVEVVNPDGDDTSVVVYVYSGGGDLNMLTNSGGSELEFSFNIAAGGSSSGPSTTPTPTPTPVTPTVEPEEEEEEAVVEPEEIEEVSGVTEETTDPPVGPSEEPSVVVSTSPPVTVTTPLPAINVIESFTYELFASSMDPGQTCRTVLKWKVGGDPNGKVEVIRNQLVIFTTTVGTAGAGMYTDTFSPGAKSYRLRTTNSAGVIQEVIQPLNVTPFCLQSFSVTAFSSNNGYLYGYQWNVAGAVNGTVRVMEQVTNDGFLDQWTQVASVGLSPSSFSHNAFIPGTDISTVCDPSRHQIFISVNGIEIASPIRNLTGLTGLQADLCVDVFISDYDVTVDNSAGGVFMHTWTVFGEFSEVTSAYIRQMVDTNLPQGGYETTYEIPVNLVNGQFNYVLNQPAPIETYIYFDGTENQMDTTPRSCLPTRNELVIEIGPFERVSLHVDVDEGGNACLQID